VTDPYGLPQMEKAAQLILDKLRVREAPRAGTLAGRFEDYARNFSLNPSDQLKVADLLTAIQARHLNAEVWTFDEKFRAKVNRLGVQVAPESYIPLPKPAGRRDYRVGLRLVGVDDIEISLSGVVTRRGPSGPPNGGGTAPPWTGGERSGGTQ